MGLALLIPLIIENMLDAAHWESQTSKLLLILHLKET